MKAICLLVLVVTAWGTATAQDARQDQSSASLPSQSLTTGAWDFGVIAGGGTGLSYARHTHFADAGGRIGLILTRNHGSGWRRGNLEWAVEMLPLYTVFTPAGAVYGGSFKPAVWRWNFTGGRTIAPYVDVAGGILFSTRNLPPGNTSWVNFTPQAALGANIFVKRDRAVLVEGAYVHHSNAGLGSYNNGYNASIFFTIGYSWFRGEH
jgi:lipid A 3-O-deacylase